MYVILLTWLSAARLRTLPLALSSIFIGSSLAASQGHFRFDIFIFALLTALSLQLLSNFANDLGDTQSGADNEHRVGPLRAVQSGAITQMMMKKAIYIVAAFAVVSGSYLLWIAFADDLSILISFVLLGLVSIAAALGYTMGGSPYGYYGFGDLAVFIFFGLVGVLGSYFLFQHHLDWWLILPAISCGLLSTAVLNINNMRDEQGDKKSGKNTLVVKMGGRMARFYQLALVYLALVCSGIFLLVKMPNSLGFIAFFVAPILLRITHRVYNSYQPEFLNKSLKYTAISALFFNSLFSIGVLLNNKIFFF